MVPCAWFEYKLLYLNMLTRFFYYVLLTVQLGTILVNNQFDAQFFMYAYVYFYSLHVSGNNVPIIRGNIVSMRHLVYVTLCR